MPQETENTNKSNKLCVLIIEEKSDLPLFYGCFNKTGNYEVKSATPMEALEIINKEATSIHVVLFDWDMKEISEMFCTKKLKTKSIMTI